MAVIEGLLVVVWMNREVCRCWLLVGVAGCARKLRVRCGALSHATATGSPIRGSYPAQNSKCLLIDFVTTCKAFN